MKCLAFEIYTVDSTASRQKLDTHLKPNVKRSLIMFEIQ